MSEDNPYSTPQASLHREGVETISESRYLANFGCGVGVLLIAVPLTSMAGYRLLTGSFEVVWGFMIGLFFILGAAHSLRWARQRRPKLPLKLW